MAHVNKRFGMVAEQMETSLDAGDKSAAGEQSCQLGDTCDVNSNDVILLSVDSGILIGANESS